MGSETIHADEKSTAAKRIDHDVPSPVPAGAADWGLRSFTVIPPYPTGVQRYASGSDDELGGTEADAGVTDALRRRKGAGRPLDRTDADRFGSGFGADLSGVRVHTDHEADTIARSVQSVAFTYGSDVYFTRGSFAPGTDSGDQLLAHELAHVVQGSSGRWAAGGSGVRIGRADDPAEAAADAAADQVMAQLRHGVAPDPALVGSLPAVQGEPIARTVRRAGLKSLKKAFRGKKKGKDAKTRPDSRLGGASIADLKAASDAAHAARHQPSSSSSSSGPERKRRSSSHSSRSGHHDESKTADHSGEGSESEDEEKGGRYETDLKLSSFTHGYSVPGSLDFDDDLGSESEVEEKGGRYETDLKLSSFAHGYSVPGSLDLGDSDSESSESEDEEKGHHYSRDLNLGSRGAGYSVPGSLDLDEAESDGSESEDDDAIFGGGDSESSESEDEKGGRYHRSLDLGLGRPGYSVPGNLDLDEVESDGSESEDDDAIFGPEPQLRDEDESEGSESEGEEPAPDEQKKRGHRAFLIRNLPAAFADETKSGRSGMEGPIGNIAKRITRAREAIAILEGGGTVAAAIAAVVMAGVAKDLRAVGEDTEAALKIVRDFLNDQLEFVRRQDLPIDAEGKLGDLSTRTVHYDSQEEQAKSLVTANGGKLYRSGGEPVDTSKSSTFHNGNGVEVFVASNQGEIHMASHQIGKYHHSSLLAGDQVSVGGEMKVTGGKIDWISNKSGHYMPTQEHLVQFVHWLGKDGIDLKSFVIKDGFGFKGGMTAEEFVAGVDEQGVKDEAKSFHSIKLDALLYVYKTEQGRADVEDFLESKGWEDMGGEVVDEDTMDTIDPKLVISELKKQFGPPGYALEKV